MNFTASPRARRLGLGAGALVVIAAIIGVMAFAAVAKTNDPTIGVAKSVKVGTRAEPIAVNGKGIAVYDLVPETTHHLLCTSAMCLKAWPPVKVATGAKLTKAAAVKGNLGTVARRGYEQVTLNGHPLYTFIEDANKKGVAKGNGIKAFGGTWHVFSEGRATGAPAAPTTTTTTTTTRTPIYTEPYTGPSGH